MKLLLDYSVLCMQAWHRMSSLNYEPRSDIEIEEFARNLSGLIYSLMARFKPSETILAMDKNVYWRHKPYNEYYAEHCEVYVEKFPLPAVTTIINGRKQKITPTEDVYYLIYDMKYREIKYISSMDKYEVKVMKKAQKETLDQRLESDDCEIEVPDDIPEGIQEFIPSYKGNRKSLPWDYDTPKKEYHEKSRAMANQLAASFGIKIVEVGRAEADDIAYCYHELNLKNDCIFVTTDTDWHQLLRRGSYIKFYNPTLMEFLDKSPEKASLELAMKIMVGDAGDNIMGIALKGAKALLPKPAKKNKKMNKTELLLEEHGTGIYKYLFENAVPHMLQRNYQMIYLPNCPKNLIKEIGESIENATIGNPEGALTLEQYGHKEVDIMDLNFEALDLRKKDIEEGHYEN